jgi:putative thioredoxin
MAARWVIEATDRDFEAAVLERSAAVPVVVDFWAPWCGPCRTLGPLLERLAEEHAGAFVLAKVNVDDNPGLAQAFGVQGIPMVLAIRDGEVVDHFTGALPESAVRQFLGSLLPTEADELSAEGEAQLARGDTDAAERSFRTALERDARHGGALVGLATVLASGERAAEALELLRRVDPGPHRARADKLAAELRIRQTGGADVEALRRRAEADPDDLEARFALAQAHAAAGRHEDALRTYLGIVARDRSFRDDEARKAMLDLFHLLGPEHPLTDQYRSELAKVLFR